MTHVRTSLYYPQSNGKLERWHQSLKAECIRPGTPLSPDDARRLVKQYVDHYNGVRLHSAIGYITTKDMLAGRQQAIHAELDRKLEQPASNAGYAANRPRKKVLVPERRRSYNDFIRRNGSGLCRDATMPRIAWWAHRDDDWQSENQPLVLPHPQDR
jgi:hypothetical protein